MLSSTEPNIFFASDHSMLVSFGNEMRDDIRQVVHRFSRLLLEETQKGILNIHPAYSSVLISYDPRMINPDDLERYVQGLVPSIETVRPPQSRTIDIPVCYGGEYGPDLQFVATHNRLAVEEVIRLHTSGTYTVYFLGFSPGFPYLGGMPIQIATPRRETPLLSIPPGSVAIGGNQTGIYPVTTPGGWRIVGRTPLKLFSPNAPGPTLLQMGDHVRFISISYREFEAVART